MPNHIQADYRIPTPVPLPTVQPHPAGSPTGNPMGLSWPLTRYVDPVTDKDDPAGSIRAGRSGK